MKVQSLLINFFAFIALISCEKNLSFDDINIEEICKGIFFSPRPYPGDNTLYIGCIRGLFTVLRCFENEIFDENLLECIFQVPETTTEFTSTTSTYSESTTTEITYPESTTTSEITTEPTTPKPKNPCEGITYGRIPHPNDCTLCQMCFLHQIMDVECTCEPGQIFWINDCVSGDPQSCEPY